MKSESVNCSASTIAALRSGDVSAFESVFVTFGPKLYAFALHLTKQREEAEEIVQEVFLKVWEQRQQLDLEQNFDGYLFSIARNIAYNKARRKVYEFAFAQYAATTAVAAVCYTEEAMAYQDLEKLLEDTYTALPPVRRQVFLLSRVEGKSNSEIARALNTSISNVENHLHKALKFIKEKFRISNAH